MHAQGSTAMQISCLERGKSLRSSLLHLAADTKYLFLIQSSKLSYALPDSVISISKSSSEGICINSGLSSS